MWSDGLRDSECQYHLRHNSLVPGYSNIRRGAILAKFYTWPGNEVRARHMQFAQLHVYLVHNYCTIGW